MAAEPRFATKHRRNRRSYGAEVAKVAEQLGTPLMPWQQRVADVGLEFRAAGPPWYPTSVVTVPRQQGKTVLVAAIATWRAMKWPDQYILFIAQTRTKAADRLSDVALKLTRAGVDGVKVYRGIGNEHIMFSNGSRITIESPNMHAAHGDSIDMAVLDEVWTLGEHVLEGVVPAMSARPNSQMWAISTMGDEDSDTLNRLVAQGREAVTDPRASICFHEWAADVEAGDDVFNPEHWQRWMPALGLTTSTEKLLPNLELLSPGAFQRAYGNVLSSSDQSVFPSEWWAETADPYLIPPPGGLVVSFDVNYDPAGAAIAAAFPTDAGWHVDVVEYQGGQSVLWLVKTLRDLIANRRPLAVASAGGGPARAVMPEIEGLCKDRLIPFRTLSVQDLGAAAGYFADGLRQRTLSHGISPMLDIAVAGARAKETGDLWRFDRKAMRVDASPLIAASVALFAAQEVRAVERKPALFFA